VRVWSCIKLARLRFDDLLIALYFLPTRKCMDDYAMSAICLSARNRRTTETCVFSSCQNVLCRAFMLGRLGERHTVYLKRVWDRYMFLSPSALHCDTKTTKRILMIRKRRSAHLCLRLPCQGEDKCSLSSKSAQRQRPLCKATNSVL
jgi:hypothetical protein